MPKHDKKRSKQQSDSDSDSGPDDKNPPPAKKSAKSGPPMENGEPTWELGQNKKVKVCQLFFKMLQRNMVQLFLIMSFYRHKVLI